MLKKAKEIDDRRAKGQTVGLLGGLPVAVKDLICTKGELTTCALKILADFRPPYDATIVEKLVPPMLCSWAARTWMSSPWAARMRTPRFFQRETLGT